MKFISSDWNVLVQSNKNSTNRRRPPASDDDALVSDVSSFKVLMAIIRRCIKALEVYRLMY